MGWEKESRSNEIIFYHHDQLSAHIEVKVRDETIWLTQAQIVSLFDSSKSNISEHIKHIFQTGELFKDTTVRKIRTVREEGGRRVERELIHYNLDMIISIGYRVNSIRGTQFRIWANKVLKDHLLKGYSLNQRMNRIENTVDDLTERVQGIELSIHSGSLPSQGVFFDGQVFDAFVFVTDLIKSADHSITLIDNYIDEQVLTLLSKKKKAVSVTIYTSKVSKHLELSARHFNEQFPNLKINTFKRSHDRFLIIDEKDIYHIGASLKDLGKKWFAFSKLQIDPQLILKRIDK